MMKQWRKSGHVVEPMECKEMQAQNSTVIQMQERKKEEDLEKKMSREEAGSAGHLESFTTYSLFLKRLFF